MQYFELDGGLTENAVFNELLKTQNDYDEYQGMTRYRRTKSDAEVDIVIKRGKRIV